MRRSLLCLCTLSLFGCDFSASGSASAGATTVPEGPAKPEYERSYDELMDVPNQMSAQVAWAAEPIDNAIHLADEIAVLRTELNIDAETFSSMFTVALKDGQVEIGAVTMAEDAKAKVEATLNKIKQVGKDLQGVPGRVKAAGQAIGKMAMSTPKLALATSKELTGQLAAAVGDQGIQIKADIKTAKELPATIKAEASEAKDVLATLPDKAVQATTNLMAAIKGEPFEPMSTTGEGGGEGEAGGETAAGGGGEVAAAGSVDAGAGATASTGGDAGASGSSGGSGGGTGGAAPVAEGGVIIPPQGTGPNASFPPAAVQARISTLQRIAKETSDRGDWKSAADAFEEAYILAPENIGIAYKVGDSAAKAKDCDRARVYLERFVQYADPTMFAPEIAISNKTLGELKSFECPPRTPDDEVALAKTLSIEAEKFGVEGDWGGAATTYAIAYQLDPTSHVYAYDVAVASWNARECADAATYFNYFASVADPKVNRVQLRETKKYQEEQSAGMCPVWAVGEKETLARDLYAQGQSRDQELNFKAAIDKYERAYYLLPTNHALAFRIGESAWKALQCEKAGQSYQDFINNVDANDPRYATDVATAKNMLAKISSAGCPNALWSGTGGGGGAAVATDTPDKGKKDKPGRGGGAGDENPPSSGRSGGSSSTVACSVGETSTPAGGIALVLLGVAGLMRRRRG